jgi:hypothetical protein
MRNGEFAGGSKWNTHRCREYSRRDHSMIPVRKLNTAHSRPTPSATCSKHILNMLLFLWLQNLSRLDCVRHMKRTMGIAGYVFVWLQLYCVTCHCFTTCFGLHGHLQVWSYVSICIQLYCVGFHCFTTCFGLHGHLQVWSYVSVCVQLCCVGFHCFTTCFGLHGHLEVWSYVSACVMLYYVGFHCLTTCFGLHGHLQVCRMFYFHMLEGFCLAASFSRSKIFQGYENKTPYTWRWPCRPKHVVKDSENQHNKAARRQKHTLHTWRWPCRPKHVVKQR